MMSKDVSLKAWSLKPMRRPHSAKKSQLGMDSPTGSMTFSQICRNQPW